MYLAKFRRRDNETNGKRCEYYLHYSFNCMYTGHVREETIPFAVSEVSFWLKGYDSIWARYYKLPTI